MVPHDAAAANERNARFEEIMAQQKEIEAPCIASRYRVLKRIAANPDNYLAVGFGGGSVPGLAGNIAFAGLLSELELRPHIKEVWGTSAGSIVGGSWCTGAPVTHMLELLETLNSQGAVDFAKWEVLVLGLLRLLLFKRMPEGLIRGNRFRAAIRDSLLVERFEDCDLPFRAIACTDDGRAEKVIFRSGPLEQAIIASMCLPGIMFPTRDWDGKPFGYFDGGVVEKTPLASIIEEHIRHARKKQLVILCTHFSDSGRSTRPTGFIQRLLSTIYRMEDVVWEYQALKAREAENCKFLVLNPHTKEGGPFDFSVAKFNYLWARKMFKEQLSNAQLAIRFGAR